MNTVSKMSDRRAGVLASLLGLLATGPLPAATLTVLNSADSGPGSLRQALLDAAPGDTVSFAAAGLQGGQTITLTTSVTVAGVTGGLAVPVNVTVTGVGAMPVSIVDSATRPFNFAVATLTAVTLQDLNITGIASDGNVGGAIRSAVGSSSFKLTIDQCSVNGSNSGSSGGAIGSSASDSLLITNSFISGTMTATGKAGLGGGAISIGPGDLRLVDSTVSNSSATGNGGAIAVNGGDATTVFSTISGNSATGSGGGLYVSAGTAFLFSTILAGNTDSSGERDIDTGSNTVSINSEYSLIQNDGGRVTFSIATIVGQDPLLSPAANNGGPTKTMALQAGSPAINAADLCDELSADYHDQRGKAFPRSWGGRPDMGAFEFGDPLDLIFLAGFEVLPACA